MHVGVTIWDNLGAILSVLLAFSANRNQEHTTCCLTTHNSTSDRFEETRALLKACRIRYSPFFLVCFFFKSRAETPPSGAIPQPVGTRGSRFDAGRGHLRQRSPGSRLGRRRRRGTRGSCFNPQVPLLLLFHSSPFWNCDRIATWRHSRLLPAE